MNKKLALGLVASLLMISSIALGQEKDSDMALGAEANTPNSGKCYLDVLTVIGKVGDQTVLNCENSSVESSNILKARASCMKALIFPLLTLSCQATYNACNGNFSNIDNYNYFVGCLQKAKN
jgi:hypothetical protein